MSTEPVSQEEVISLSDPISALHGMLADGPSLTADLLTERKRELEKEELRISAIHINEDQDILENLRSFARPAS